MLASAATGVAPRRRDLDFPLFDVLDLAALLRLPHVAEHDRATLDVVLDTAYDIAADYFARSAAELDAFPFGLDDGFKGATIVFTAANGSANAYE